MRTKSLSVLSVVVSLWAGATFAAIPQSERDALVAFYDATGGPSWNDSSGWLGAPGTECSWFGITCDATESHVTRIWMQSNGLAGTLPGSISQLTELDTLEIFDARLSGTVPSSLATMSKLTRLNLGTQRFFEEGGLEGEFPSFLLDMTQLEYLSLEGNTFSGPIPADISRLENLQSLRLGYNDFTGDFPAGIATMTELVDIDLTYCPITGSIPEAIGNLSKLESFTIQFCNMGGTLPNSLGELKELRGLVIQGNDFHGPIPESIGGLANLTAVFIGVSNLEGPIPMGIWTNPNIISLYPYNMPYLTGPIPPEIGQMTNLRFFVATGTPFGGPIPKEIGQLQNLVTFMVTGCHLEGSIPAEMGSMPNLTILRMNYNRLSGPIPATLGSLPSLEVAHLANNQLSGEIPPELGNLPVIESLNLGGNLLTGSIPPVLASAPKLRQLALHGNRLSGDIPVELNASPALRELAISGNRFEGPVPGTILALPIVDGGGSFSYNALRTDDPAIDEFLDRKENFGEWERAQTKPPGGMTATDVGSFSVLLEWPFAEPLEVPGGYQVLASTSPGGPYSLLRTTPSKFATSQLVTGLMPESDYYFVVRSVSYPHYFNAGGFTQGEFIHLSALQPNTLFSQPSSEVHVRTLKSSPTPARVVLSSLPEGLAQTPDSGGAATAFTLSNLGGTSTSLTLSSNGSFFEFTPQSFDLSPGADQVVAVSGLPQPEGFYTATLDVAGAGVPPTLEILIELASINAPEVGYSLRAEANRVDVSAPVGDDPTGSVTFRNDGTGTFSGFLVADVDWIESASGLVTIAPGESATLPFSIDRSKRPDAEQLAGAVAGGLRMLTVSGASAKGTFDGPPAAAGAVSVVDTVKPPTSNLTALPPLSPGEVALFVPGIGHAVGSVGLFISDISILNSFGSKGIDDVRLYYRELSGNASKSASLDPVAVSGSVSLADVVSTVFEGDSEVGTLQIRSSAVDALSVSANIFNASNSSGTYGTAIPAFRSDRAAVTGESIYLTGLQSSETSHTNIYVQETSGLNATFTADIFDRSGTRVASLGGEVEPFGMTRLLTSVPVGGVSARITQTSGDGAIVAYATPVDRRSGDTWAVSDWGAQFGYEKTRPVVIPVAGSVRGASETFFRTELAITNIGCHPIRGILDYYEDTGAVHTLDVVLDPLASRVFDDVVGSFGITSRSLGYLTFTPLPLILDPPDPIAACNEPPFAVSSRTFATVGDDPGTYGTGVPVLSLDSAIRAGQQRKLGGLEDSRTSTVLARTPATFRTNFALIEASGEPITVRARVFFSDPRSLAAGAALGTKEFELGPRQSLQVSGLVGSIVGVERDTKYGDLRNVQIEFQVVEGDGSLIVYTSSVDNGTGDSSLRVE